jgi:hypothetical protein
MTGKLNQHYTSNIDNVTNESIFNDNNGRSKAPTIDVTAKASKAEVPKKKCEMIKEKSITSMKGFMNRYIQALTTPVTTYGMHRGSIGELQEYAVLGMHSVESRNGNIGGWFDLRLEQGNDGGELSGEKLLTKDLGGLPKGQQREGNKGVTVSTKTIPRNQNTESKEQRTSCDVGSRYDRTGSSETIGVLPEQGWNHESVMKSGTLAGGAARRECQREWKADLYDSYGQGTVRTYAVLM